MYTLQKYRGMNTRFTCPICHRPKCFTYYIDENGNRLAPIVGRCDHESSCGWHYKPRDFFRDHPDRKIPDSWKAAMVVKEKPLCFIGKEWVKHYLSTDSNLIKFLCSLFNPMAVHTACMEYLVGATAEGETIFWQIDHDGRPRSAKIIQYGEDGHRVKDGAEVKWLHPYLKRSGDLPDSWELTQCLFGEHLLRQNPNSRVCLVESEKTALIMSLIQPNDSKGNRLLWLATGGKYGINYDKMLPLKGRTIIVYPDADAWDAWKAYIERLKNSFTFVLPNNMFNTAQTERKYDLADLYLEKYAIT